MKKRKTWRGSVFLKLITILAPLMTKIGTTTTLPNLRRVINFQSFEVLRSTPNGSILNGKNRKHGEVQCFLN